MVKYQEFVSLCFEIKRDRGRNMGIAESQETLQAASALWSEAKSDGIDTASRAEAKNWLRNNA